MHQASHYLLRCLVGLALSVSISPISAGKAQVIPDRTLGVEVSQVESNAPVRGLAAELIQGGATRRQTLFHSFSEFNVLEGQRVYFANPMGVESILSRVTGPLPSQILGTLGVDGAANLFLLNPNGILFGPASRLDIAGLFVATTATRFIFANGSDFSATNPQTAPLLTVHLQPGLQLGPSAGSIAQAGTLSVAAEQPLTSAGASVVSLGALQLRAGGAIVMNSSDTIVTNGRAIALEGANLSLGQINTSALPDGGQVTLTATTGDIRSNKIDTGVLGPSGGNINGAEVNITARNGSVFLTGLDERLNSVEARTITIDATGDLVVRGFLNARIDGVARAGDIEVGNTLAPSSITIGGISTRNLGGGGGGNIRLTTSGILTLTAASTRAGVTFDLPAVVSNEFSIGSEADGVGGNIDIQADGGITLLAGIISDSRQSGNGGNILLNSRNGAITIGAGTLDASSARQNAGNVSFTAAGNITIGSILANSRGGGTGGAVILTSGGTIDTRTGTVTTTAVTRSAGNVSFTAVGNITTGSILASSQGSGDAGAVTLASGGIIDTRLGIVTATSGTSLPPPLTLLGVGIGNGGSVTFSARDAIFPGTIESIGRLGGAITLRSNQLVLERADLASITTAPTVTNGGSIVLEGQSLALTDSRVGSVTTGAGQGGAVVVRAADRVEILSTGNTSLPDVGSSLLRGFKQTFSGTGIVTTTAGSGAGGAVWVETDRLTIRNLQSVVTGKVGITTATVENSQGNAGSITIQANRVELLGNESGAFIVTPDRSTASLVLSIPVGITSATQGEGDAGILTLTTRQLTIRDGAAISSGNTRAALGRGATLTVNATEFIELSGKAALATGTFNARPAGDLVINAPTGQVLLQAGALMAADTLGTGPAGNLTIATTQLNLLSGSRIGAATVGTGAGGTVTIRALEAIEVRGTSADGQIPSGLFSDSQSTATAGNLVLTTRQLAIRDGGQVTASGSNQGAAGNLVVVADSIFMENRGLLRATTAIGTGGNINLQVADSIVLRNGSEISTEAAAAANGGDITINAGKFVLAVLPEDSDVIAKAFAGNGGKISARAAGIFGFRLYEGRDTPESDFVASSDLGIDGVVDIRAEDDVEEPLPSDFLDAAALIRPGCLPGVRSLARRLIESPSRLVITGRGGLPVSPLEPLRVETVLTDWISGEGSDRSAIRLEPQAALAVAQSETIVEAQAWQQDGQGNLWLVATSAPELPLQPSRLEEFCQ